MLSFFCYCAGDHRDLHVLTHAFPTRRSSDLSGKSCLVAQALPELVLLHLGHEPEDDAAESATSEGPAVIEATGGHLAGDVDAVQRLVQVDQKPIGRMPRSNLATYTRSEEHTSELQSLMRISYAAFCLQKKTSPHWRQRSPTRPQPEPTYYPTQQRNTQVGC